MLVAGDGPEQEKLERHRKELGLEDKVIFVGRTDKPIHFLKQLDLYISFSRMEGMPLSVLEAMACELPLFLSKVEGHGAFVTFPYPQFELTSFESFSACLQPFMTNTKWSQTIPKDQFTLEAMTSGTVKLYSL